MDVQIECICPEKGKHEHDTVTLPDTLDFRRTLIVRQAIRFEVEGHREANDPLTVPELTAVMAEAYLLHCIDSWSVMGEVPDGKGKTKTGPLPVTKANVRALLLEGAYEAAEVVGNAADSLYSDKVVLPLMGRASNSLPPTPTPEPTSPPTNGSRQKGPKTPSKPSSTTTSLTVATGPMAASPGGDSSYSAS